MTMGLSASLDDAVRLDRTRTAVARDSGTKRFGSAGLRSKNSWRNSVLRSSVPTLI
jgi:hypothetical protein